MWGERLTPHLHDWVALFQKRKGKAMLVYIFKAFLTVSFLQRRLVALLEWIVPVLFSSHCPRWSGSGHANSHAKPALGEHKPSAATALLAQEPQRGGDFALQKMTAERQITSLLGTAQSLEVSAKLTDVWTRQETRGIRNRQERAWPGSPAACPTHTTESVDWKSPQHKLNPFKHYSPKKPPTERFTCSNNWP